MRDPTSWSRDNKEDGAGEVKWRFATQIKISQSNAIHTAGEVSILATSILKIIRNDMPRLWKAITKITMLNEQLLNTKK